MATTLHQNRRIVDPDIKREHSPPLTTASARSTRPTRAEPPSSAQSEWLVSHETNSEAQVKARLIAAASENSDLLVTLQDTEHIPKLLIAKRVHIEKLQTELNTQEILITEIERSIEALKRGRHTKSTALWLRLKRLLAVLRGDKPGDQKDVKQNADDELKDGDEKAYFETLGEKSKAEHRRTELKHQITVSGREEKNLLVQAEKHGKAHEDLETLYESIFAGHTPGFAAEDAAEAAFQAAIALHLDAKEYVLGIRKGLLHLEQAKRSWRQAGIYLHDAKTGTDSVGGFGFGVTTVRSDLLNFDHYQTTTSAALDRAAEKTAMINNAANQMRRILGASTINYHGKLDKGSLLEMLSGAEERLIEGNKALDNLVESVKQWQIEGRMRVRDTAGELEERRSRLQQVRQEAFEQVVGFGVAPPDYNNCCPKQDAYEAECDIDVNVNVDEDI